MYQSPGWERAWTRRAVYLKERHRETRATREEYVVSAVTKESSEFVLQQDLGGLSRADRTRFLLEAAAAAASPAERTALEGRVIETNLAVAAQIAARYHNRGVAHDDLEQVAYLALVKAVRRYEYAPDRDFLSFAVPTIRGELRRHFRDVGWTIRPTRRVQETQTRITQAEGALLQRLGRSPRPSEIAEYLDLDPDVVLEALSANGCFNPSSLESTMTADDGQVTERLGEEDAGFHNVETRVLLRPLLAHLTDRERIMLEMRFFRGATQAEVGEAIGVTQMQVSRLLSDLMTRLREQLMIAEQTEDPERQPAA
jgi:RNA polymerase sigma-B factor